MRHRDQRPQRSARAAQSGFHQQLRTVWQPTAVVSSAAENTKDEEEEDDTPIPPPDDKDDSDESSTQKTDTESDKAANKFLDFKYLKISLSVVSGRVQYINGFLSLMRMASMLPTAR